MPYYKFGPNDIFHNTIKAHPKCDFFIYGSRVYYNNTPKLSGKHTNVVTHMQDFDSRTGYISLYEINVDRPSGDLIYPFVTKDGTLSTFKSVTITALNEADYGDEFQGTYPLSASISREFHAEDAAAGQYPHHMTGSSSKPRIVALKNTFDKYENLSPHYAYETSIWHKGKQDINLISIPSIFYGSSIKKGTVELKFFISGTIAGHLIDERKNGELIQVAPYGSNGSGSVAGVVLYNEGFISLTGSWTLDFKHQESYDGIKNPKWIYFAAGANDGLAPGLMPSSSFSIALSGTEYTPVVTMLARAPKGMFNHSNNITYLELASTYSGSLAHISSSHMYRETEKGKIKNIVSSSHCDHTASFKKTTFISKVGIYDNQKNLIAIAKMATPVRKTEEDEYTFKLKLDI